MAHDIAPLAAPGRQQSRLAFEVVRAVTEQDLVILESAPPRTSNIAPIKQLSERHHRLARMIGTGIRPGEAAIVCGYNASHVSILQNNPAFADLVSFYKSEEEKAFLSTYEKLSDLASTTIGALQERAENSPDDLSTNELIRIAELTLDRSGNGPASTVTQLNVSLSARLDEARSRAKQALIGALNV